MPRYSPLADSIVLQEDLLSVLKPSSVEQPELLSGIREADADRLLGGKPVGDPEMLEVVRAALFYALDALDDSHPIVQEVSSDTGSCWHAMIHRREGDFDNARYWYRRTGAHPAFAELHERASSLSPDFARQLQWDPYLFTTLCERAAFGEPRDDLVPLQRAEFEVLFDYTWRQAVAG